MKNHDFSEQLSMKKLNLFLKYACKGFALLTINESSIRHQIENHISKEKKTVIYHFQTTEYREMLHDLDRHSKEEVVIFSDFSMKAEKACDLMENFNLGRDLILDKVKCCFFIVPLYLESYVQEKLPNLFDYFLLKERFIREFQNPFSYILPEDDYLKTEVLQSDFKGNREELEEKIAGLSEEQDILYIRKLRSTFAKEAIVRGEYEEAIRQWDELLEFYERQNLYGTYIWQAYSGKANVYLYEGQYKKALEIYKKLLILIGSDKNGNMKITEEYVLNSYSSIALCFVQMGEYESAKDFIQQALYVTDQNKDNDAELVWDYFRIYYNCFLMYLEMDSNPSAESFKMLKRLKKCNMNLIQKSLIFTVRAWHKGVLEGDVNDGLLEANEALYLKLHSDVENDRQIVESYYVNTVLNLFAGKENVAHHYAEKGLNVLNDCDVLKEKNVRFLKKQLEKITTR